jgi:hypothetical protein
LAVLFVVVFHLPLTERLLHGSNYHPGALGLLGVVIFFVHTCLVLLLSLQRQIKRHERSREDDLGGTREHAGSQRILILTIGGLIAGFLVDSVSEVMKVEIDAIRSAPELSPDQMRLISRVINLEAKGRLILLVDPTQLLDQVEADVLAKFKRAELDPPVTAP